MYAYLANLLSAFTTLALVPAAAPSRLRRHPRRLPHRHADVAHSPAARRQVTAN